MAAEDPTSGGTIEGTVVYRAGDKPWRYARYYVSDPKKGLLAEAVVALRARSLRGLFPPESPRTSVIDQKNFQFVPETIAIRVGEQSAVVWN